MLLKWYRDRSAVVELYKRSEAYDYFGIKLWDAGYFVGAQKNGYAPTQYNITTHDESEAYDVYRKALSWAKGGIDNA